MKLHNLIALVIPCMLFAACTSQTPTAGIKDIAVNIVKIDDTPPDAEGKFEFKQGKIIHVVDTAGIGNLPPTIVLGKTVTLTSEKYDFPLAPTNTESHVLALHKAKETVMIVENGKYTFFLFNPTDESRKAIGKSYFLKTDEEELHKTLQDSEKRLRKKIAKTASRIFDQPYGGNVAITKDHRLPMVLFSFFLSAPEPRSLKRFYHSAGAFLYAKRSWLSRLKMARCIVCKVVPSPRLLRPYCRINEGDYGSKNRLFLIQCVGDTSHPEAL